MGNETQPESLESLLLDLHLRRLEPEQAAQVEDRLAASPELADRSRALRDLLGLLDAYEVPEPPENLADHTLARIEQESAVLPFKEPASAVPAGTAHDLSASPVLSLRELIAIAACITLFVGIFVPGYFKAQKIAQQSRCGYQMGQIYQATVQYAQANNGYTMCGTYVPGGSWLPTRVPGVLRVSATKPTYKLIRYGFVRDPRIFVCPSAPDGRTMIADDYQEFDDFPEPANITYSSMFMNLPRGRRLEDMHPMMVLVADRNPLFDSRAAAHDLNPYDDGNSFAHGAGAGQNAIHVTGQRRWCAQPTIGVNQDNIYRAGQLVRYQGTEQPTSLTDTFLP